jgi:hypothetical protein
MGNECNGCRRLATTAQATRRLPPDLSRGPTPCHPAGSGCTRSSTKVGPRGAAGALLSTHEAVGPRAGLVELRRGRRRGRLRVRPDRAERRRHEGVIHAGPQGHTCECAGQRPPRPPAGESRRAAWCRRRRICEFGWLSLSWLSSSSASQHICCWIRNSVHQEKKTARASPFHQPTTSSHWISGYSGVLPPSASALANAAALQVNLSHSSFGLTLAVGAFASHLISGIPMSNRG